MCVCVHVHPDGITTDSVGTNRQKWRAVSSNVVNLILWKQRNGTTRRPIEWCMSYFASTHKEIHGTQSRFWCIWACTRFEAHDAGSKQKRFSYDYAISSHISTLQHIIFHTQICQCAHKLLWSIDGKTKMGLISSVWRHCRYDDSVGTWHDAFIKWKHFPRYWPFVWEIHRSPVISPHKGQWLWSLLWSAPERTFE